MKCSIACRESHKEINKHRKPTRTQILTQYAFKRYDLMGIKITLKTTGSRSEMTISCSSSSTPSSKNLDRKKGDRADNTNL
jgi:hypothetical protein